MTRSAYLDTSALVKLVVAEAETSALRAFLAGWPERASSAIARTEAVRAARRRGPDALGIVHELLSAIDLMPLDDELLDAAGHHGPTTLRTLDAIHLASAVRLGADLGVLVTYDERLADAAREFGLPVASPG